MKLKILLIMASIVMTSVLFGLYSDDFLIGAYCNDNDPNLLPLIKNANFNCIMENAFDPGVLDIYKLDYIGRDYNGTANGVNRGLIHELTRANHYVYEAEYCKYNPATFAPFSHHANYEVPLELPDGWPKEVWFYGMVTDPAINVYRPENSLPSLDSWHYINCAKKVGTVDGDPNAMGYLIRDMRQKSYDDPDTLKQYLTHQIYLGDMVETYFISFKIRFNRTSLDGNDTEPVIRLGFKVLLNDSNMYEVPLESCEQNLYASNILSSADLNRPLDPSNPEDQWHEYKFKVSADMFRSTAKVGPPVYPNDGQAILSWGGRMNYSTPVIYYYNRGSFDIDCITIEDNVYRDLDAGVYNNQIEGTLFSANEIGTLGYDEPTAPNFAAIGLINARLQSVGKPSVTSAVSPSYEWTSDAYLYGDYNHQILYDHFVKNEKTIISDRYPLSPNTDIMTPFNQWNYFPAAPATSVFQVGLARTTANYRSNKNLCLSKGMRFYPAVQNFGAVIGLNTTSPKWGYWLYPPVATIKVLNYLPLCYGADGILSFTFNGFMGNAQDGFLKGLVNKAGYPDYSGAWETGLQYDAVKHANAEIACIGKIIKNLDTWNGDNAKTIVDQSVSYPATFGSITNITVNATDNLGGHSDYDETYAGYVDCTLYTKAVNNAINREAYLMLVNHRTNFLKYAYTDPRAYSDPVHFARTLSPDWNLAKDPDIAFATADPQTVTVFLNSNSELNNYAMIDQYTGNEYEFYRTDQRPNYQYSCSFPIDAGDGSLMKLDTILSETITANTTISNRVINKNLTVSGCDLTIGDNVTLCQNAKILVTNSGRILISPSNSSISRKVVQFVEGSGIEIQSGSLIASKTDFSGIANSRWAGIYVDNNGYANLDDCNIYSAETGIEYRGIVSIVNTTPNTSTVISNCKTGLIAHNNTNLNLQNMLGLLIKVPENGVGINVVNAGTNDIFVGNSIAKISIETMPGATLGTGVLSIPGLGAQSQTLLQFENIQCINLKTGFDISLAKNSKVNILSSSFNTCHTGINILGNSQYLEISNCSFEGNNTSSVTDFDMGIKINTAGGKISNCTFDLLQSEDYGILLYNCSKIGIEKYPIKIDNCTFQHSKYGVFSIMSSPRISNSVFESWTGIVCSNDSYSDLSWNSNNFFKCTYTNVLFAMQSFLTQVLYHSSLYLLNGHNDFNSIISGRDIVFHGSIQSPNEILNLNGNWWNDDFPNVLHQGGNQYTLPHIVFDSFDPDPNTHNDQTATTRFDQAMSLEKDLNYDLAISEYKAILEEKLPAEKPFWYYSIDKIFNLTCTDEISAEATKLYLENIKYAIPDSLNELEKYAMNDIIDTYLMKCDIVMRDYVSALEKAGYKLDNAESMEDSLLYMMCLESIYQMMSFESDKSSGNTAYDKYKPKNHAEFSSRYQAHMNQYLNTILGGMPSENNVNIPKVVTLAQNYPNPFNPETTLSFSIPADGKVELAIYNIKGQKVKTLINETMPMGGHKVVWNGKNSSNKNVSSGVYFYKLTSSGKTQVKKMLLMK